jgi:tRNA uridine 5-carboxymethylaminomethyl modification enzyme
LKRSEAYIGVLIDDLVTKDNREPYRMMTSRAEYRLLLRQDNADLRLRKYGYRVGLISQEQYDHVCEKEKMIEDEIRRLKNIRIGAARENQEYLRAHNSADLKTACSLAELMCRPELGYEQVAGLDSDRKPLPKEVTEQVEINIRYEGYIARQRRQVEQFEKMENRKIPEKIDYDDVGSLRLEARQKLKEFRPSSIGQAGRLSGVTPADVAVLLIYLEKFRAQFNSGQMTGAGTESNTEMRTERKDSSND